VSISQFTNNFLVQQLYC